MTVNQEKKFQNVSKKWFFILPAIGVTHGMLGQIGLLQRGSWLNFILFLGVTYLWLLVVLNETQKPFRPLIWMGGIYGVLYAIFEILFWFLNGGLMGLGRPNESFEDLLESILYYISPFFLFFVRIVYGVLIGALIGFLANLMIKYQQRKR